MGIFGKLKELIFGPRANLGEQGQSSKTGRNEYAFSESDNLVARRCSVDALRVFSESLNIANKSKNIVTRQSRLQVARNMLIDLKALTNKYPFFHLENLQAVEASIVAVENETRALIAAQPKPKIITTVQESQNNQTETRTDNRDVIRGLQFVAAMQLRTPLRVLLRHGEIHTDRKTAPPKIIEKKWEGIWTTKTKTFCDSGLGIDEIPATGASDFSQIPGDGGEYLKFLIEVRKIVEMNESIEIRIAKLLEMAIVADWQMFLNRYGPSRISESKGIDWIIEYFFPRFIKSIPKLTAGTVDSLSKLGLTTPNRIAAAPDEMLLNIKGIGQAKLKTIRGYCASITDNRNADRVENVHR